MDQDTQSSDGVLPDGLEKKSRNSDIKKNTRAILESVCSDFENFDVPCIKQKVREKSVTNSHADVVQQPRRDDGAHRDEVVTPLSVEMVVDDTTMSATETMPESKVLTLNNVDSSKLSMVPTNLLGLNEDISSSVAELADAEIVQTGENSVSIIITNPRFVEVMTGPEGIQNASQSAEIINIPERSLDLDTQPPVKETKRPMFDKPVIYRPNSNSNAKARRITARMKSTWARELETRGHLTCPLPGCMQTFETMTNFRTHYKFCAGTARFEKCLHCSSLIIASKSAMLHHMQVEHPEKLPDDVRDMPPPSPGQPDDCFVADFDGSIYTEEIQAQTSRPERRYKTKRKLSSSKENFILSKKKGAIFKNKKRMKESLIKNIEEFRKCVKFDSIVDKIKGVEEVLHHSHQVNKPQKMKRRRLFLTSNVVEKEKFFDDETDDPVPDSQYLSPVNTKSRLVLPFEPRYKRYSEHLRVSRDWTSARRTYSRSRPPESEASPSVGDGTRYANCDVSIEESIGERSAEISSMELSISSDLDNTIERELAVERDGSLSLPAASNEVICVANENEPQGFQDLIREERPIVVKTEKTNPAVKGAKFIFYGLTIQKEGHSRSKTITKSLASKEDGIKLPQNGQVLHKRPRGRPPKNKLQGEVVQAPSANNRNMFCKKGYAVAAKKLKHAKRGRPRKDAFQTKFVKKLGFHKAGVKVKRGRPLGSHRVHKLATSHMQALNNIVSNMCKAQKGLVLQKKVPDPQDNLGINGSVPCGPEIISTVHAVANSLPEKRDSTSAMSLVVEASVTVREGQQEIAKPAMDAVSQDHPSNGASDTPGIVVSESVQTLDGTPNASCDNSAKSGQANELLNSLGKERSEVVQQPIETRGESFVASIPTESLAKERDGETAATPPAEKKRGRGRPRKTPLKEGEIKVERTPKPNVVKVVPSPVSSSPAIRKSQRARKSTFSPDHSDYVSPIISQKSSKHRNESPVPNKIESPVVKSPAVDMSENVVKRKRGRPRKNSVAPQPAADSMHSEEPEASMKVAKSAVTENTPGAEESEWAYTGIGRRKHSRKNAPRKCVRNIETDSDAEKAMVMDTSNAICEKEPDASAPSNVIPSERDYSPGERNAESVEGMTECRCSELTLPLKKRKHSKGFVKKCPHVCSMISKSPPHKRKKEPEKKQLSSGCALGARASAEVVDESEEALERRTSKRLSSTKRKNLSGTELEKEKGEDSSLQEDEEDSEKKDRTYVPTEKEVPHPQGHQSKRRESLALKKWMGVSVPILEGDESDRFLDSEKRLFPDYLCEKSVFCRELPNEENIQEAYMPPFETSLNFLVGSSPDWTKLRRFESVPIEKAENHFTFFTGGPILCSAFCPTPEGAGSSQYVALSINVSLSRNTYGCGSEGRERERGQLQLWNVGNLHDRSRPETQPRLELALCHQHLVYDLAFCPGPVYDDPGPQPPEEEEHLPRLGLLAAACSDSLIRIYAIPHPASLPEEGGGGGAPRLCFGRPVAVLEPLCEEKDRSACVSLSWERKGDRARICGGYGSGLVCIYLLKQASAMSGGGGAAPLPKLSPYSCFQAHGAPVTSISFAPLLNGRFLLTSSFDRVVKFWDLHGDVCAPVSWLPRKGVMRHAHWPPHQLGSFGCLEDGTSLTENFANSQPGSSHKRRSQELPLRLLTNHGHACTKSSVSEFLNAQVVVDMAGTVSVSVLYNPKMSHPINALVYSSELKELRSEMAWDPSSEEAALIVGDLVDVILTVEGMSSSETCFTGLMGDSNCPEGDLGIREGSVCPADLAAASGEGGLSAVEAQTCPDAPLKDAAPSDAIKMEDVEKTVPDSSLGSVNNSATPSGVVAETRSEEDQPTPMVISEATASPSQCSNSSANTESSLVQLKDNENDVQVSEINAVDSVRNMMCPREKHMELQNPSAILEKDQNTIHASQNSEKVNELLVSDSMPFEQGFAPSQDVNPAVQQSMSARQVQGLENALKEHKNLDSLSFRPALVKEEHKGILDTCQYLLETVSEEVSFENAAEVSSCNDLSLDSKSKCSILNPKEYVSCISSSYYCSKANGIKSECLDAIYQKSDNNVFGAGNRGILEGVSRNVQCGVSSLEQSCLSSGISEISDVVSFPPSDSNSPHPPSHTDSCSPPDSRCSTTQEISSSKVFAQLSPQVSSQTSCRKIRLKYVQPKVVPSPPQFDSKNSLTLSVGLSESFNAGQESTFSCGKVSNKNEACGESLPSLNEIETTVTDCLQDMDSLTSLDEVDAAVTICMDDVDGTVMSLDEIVAVTSSLDDVQAAVTNLDEIVMVTSCLDEIVTVSSCLDEMEAAVTSLDEVGAAVTSLDEVEAAVTCLDEVEAAVTSLDEVEASVTSLDEVEAVVVSLDEVATVTSCLDDVRVTVNTLDEVATVTSCLDDVQVTVNTLDEVASVSCCLDEIEAAVTSLDEIATVSSCLDEVEATVISLEEVVNVTSSMDEVEDTMTSLDDIQATVFNCLDEEESILRYWNKVETGVDQSLDSTEATVTSLNEVKATVSSCTIENEAPVTSSLDDIEVLVTTCSDEDSVDSYTDEVRVSSLCATPYISQRTSEKSFDVPSLSDTSSILGSEPSLIVPEHCSCSTPMSDTQVSEMSRTSSQRTCAFCQKPLQDVMSSKNTCASGGDDGSVDLQQCSKDDEILNVDLECSVPKGTCSDVPSESLSDATSLGDSNPEDMSEAVSRALESVLRLIEANENLTNFSKNSVINRKAIEGLAKSRSHGISLGKTQRALERAEAERSAILKKKSKPVRKLGTKETRHSEETQRDETCDDKLGDLQEYDRIASTQGLVFKDNLNLLRARSQHSEASNSIETSDLDCLHFDPFNLASINTVCWNPNFGCHFWICTGAQSGIARLSCLADVAPQPRGHS